jgi:carboxypeptidase Taq
MGAIGYFPTYTLGNLYAGQLWATILRELPDTPQRVAQGEFGLLEWLRDQDAPTRPPLPRDASCASE